MEAGRDNERHCNSCEVPRELTPDCISILLHVPMTRDVVVLRAYEPPSVSSISLKARDGRPGSYPWQLARAAWDWGFGDWETALGAASHMGSRPIRPDQFTSNARAGIGG
jgi:hypothetical protein